MSESRALTEPERAMIAAAREKAYILYEGKQVPHRSCGIALAEIFELPSRPYQALGRGGIVGPIAGLAPSGSGASPGGTQ